MHDAATRQARGAGPGGATGDAGLAAARDRAALTAALDPIITIDARGTIQSASDSVRRVLGWSPGELIGRNVSMLMPEPHHSAHDGYLANYHRTGRTNILNRPRRFEALRKDGSLIPIELCVSRAEMPGGDGGVRGGGRGGGGSGGSGGGGAPLFVGIIRDMSAYAEAERGREKEQVRSQQLLAEQTSALQRANLRLRMADRMASIGTLAAGLGHDMNNVLLPVRARLNALKAAGESGKMSAAESRHVEEIRKSVAYLQQLADGLHFLVMDPDSGESARTAAGERGAEATTDLGRWWSQAGALLSKAVPKHVRVAASFPAGLPCAAVTAHGLTQAALNLIVNAGEAIPGPGARKRRQGRVRVWAEAVESGDGQWVRLCVTDNGAGMGEDVKRRAFEMFFTTKPRGLGTGLGLALVRKVVERVGGRVEIDSEVGRGTTVAMILPAARSGEPGEHEDAGVSAAISIRDGRAAALVRHMLEASGIAVLPDGDPDRAELRIVDPAAADITEVKRWRGEHPRGRLVLFGRPAPASAPAWRKLKPVVIENPDDFEAVRAAIGRAASGY